MKIRLSAILKFLPLVILLCIAVGICFDLFILPFAPYRTRSFINHWSKEFRKCSNLQAIETLQEQEKAHIYRRTFANGDWVAVKMEHACCSGAGFDATVFYDSSGKVYCDTSYTFCGYEVLNKCLNKIKADSLKDFYSVLQTPSNKELGAPLILKEKRA